MNYYLFYECGGKFQMGNLIYKCPYCHSDMIWKYKHNNKIK